LQGTEEFYFSHRGLVKTP